MALPTITSISSPNYYVRKPGQDISLTSPSTTTTRSAIGSAVFAPGLFDSPKKPSQLTQQMENYRGNEARYRPMPVLTEQKISRPGDSLAYKTNKEVNTTNVPLPPRRPADLNTTERTEKMPPPGKDTGSALRLYHNNLPEGADYSDTFESLGLAAVSSSALAYDARVYITDASSLIINNSNPYVKPLAEVGAVLFPYTPTINFAHTANYDSDDLVHTNYKHPTYRNSSVEAIQIGAVFTAATAKEAQYVAAVIHFFRTVTKMFYGKDVRAGTPPPLLYLDGHGGQMLDHIPVVVTSFTYGLPNDVDYISTVTGAVATIDDTGGMGVIEGSPGALAMVPTFLTLQLSFMPVYSRTRVSKGFGLEDYVRGNLLTGKRKGQGGPGGFI